MPKPNISVDWRTFGLEASRLNHLVSSIDTLPAGHRKLVAEIVMIRLFLLLENNIASICAKLICGVDYLDGSTPVRLINVASIPSARSAMLTFGRKKQKSWLSWTRSRDIKDNLKFTMDSTDPVFTTVDKYGQLLSEMRHVRNRIAHKNRNTQENFRKVIRQHYGGVKQGVSPGVLLLTEALGPQRPMDRYIASCRILIKDLVRA